MIHESRISSRSRKSLAMGRDRPGGHRGYIKSLSNTTSTKSSHNRHFNSQTEMVLPGEIEVLQLSKKDQSHSCLVLALEEALVNFDDRGIKLAKLKFEFCASGV